MARKSKVNKAEVDGFVKWTLVALGLIILFFVSYYAFSGIGKVKYENLVFTKDTFGNIPIYRYTYSFQSTELQKVITYRFYTRINPAKNDVPYDGVTVTFPPEGSNVYLGLDEPNLKTCGENTTLGVIGLAQFVSSNQYKLISGVVDSINAASSNRTYISCDTQPQQMKILVYKSDITKVSMPKKSCYTIEYKDCSDLLKATEKFELRAIVDAKNRAKSN